MQRAVSVTVYKSLLNNKAVLFSFIIIFSLSSSLDAQTNLSKASLNLGIINNQQDGFGNAPHSAFYPEIEIGGCLYKKYFEWSLFAGYWDDQVREPFSIVDAVTYSFNSFIFGGKVIFFPQNVLDDFILPLHLIAGLSYHHLGQRYIGGEDFYGDYFPSHYHNILAANLGLGFHFKVADFLRLRLETEAYIPVNKNNAFPQYDGSASLKLGADYLF